MARAEVDTMIPKRGLAVFGLAWLTGCAQLRAWLPELFAQAPAAQAAPCSTAAPTAAPAVSVSVSTSIAADASGERMRCSPLAGFVCLDAVDAGTVDAGAEGGS